MTPVESAFVTLSGASDCVQTKISVASQPNGSLRPSHRANRPVLPFVRPLPFRDHRIFTRSDTRIRPRERRFIKEVARHRPIGEIDGHFVQDVLRKGDRSEPAGVAISHSSRPGQVSGISFLMISPTKGEIPLGSPIQGPRSLQRAVACFGLATAPAAPFCLSSAPSAASGPPGPHRTRHPVSPASGAAFPGRGR